MKLQELSQIEDFQGLIAEDFYMSGKSKLPRHDKSIEARTIDEIGRGLYGLALKQTLLIAGVSEFYLDADKYFIGCRLIVGKFDPPNATALAYVPDLDLDLLKDAFARSASIDLLHERWKYRIYLCEAVIKVDATNWILTGKIDFK